jgi:hypothetical protein
MNANKQDAGGLPPLPESLNSVYIIPRDGGVSVETPFSDYYSVDQMRAYGEQCRAASGDSLGRIASELDQQPVFPSTQARAMWYAGLADRIRAISRGVPEGAVTDENCSQRISDMLMEVADMHGRFPQAKADDRAWAALVTYCDDIVANLRRYAYLTDDLPSLEDRRRRESILEFMGSRGKGSTDAAIDAAIAAQRKEGE